MRYMVKGEVLRANPRRVLPSAHSIISVVVPYPTEETPLFTEEWPCLYGDSHRGGHKSNILSGRVSRYARGPDYHRTVGEMLKRLARLLEEKGAKEARSFVDSGSIAERAVALRAGLGWVGKNSNLITREFGSLVFLGEILTDLDLDPDQPTLKVCEGCEACIQACPTQAIVKPYVVDARRCISYLTIESRGFIPHEFRALIGDRVFGCDTCQEVCPENPEPGTQPYLPLFPLLNIGDKEYNLRLAASPLGRAKKQGLRRNAAIVLGNIKDPRAVPALIETLADPDPIIKGHAAWALGQIGGKEAGKALEKALKTEAHEKIIREITTSLEGPV